LVLLKKKKKEYKLLLYFIFIFFFEQSNLYSLRQHENKIIMIYKYFSLQQNRMCTLPKHKKYQYYNKTSKYINTTKIGHYQNMKIKLYLLSGLEIPYSKSQSILGGMVYVTKSWRVTYKGCSTYSALIFTAFKDMVRILVHISKASTMSFRCHVVWKPLDMLALEDLSLHHVLAWDGRPYRTT